MSTTPATRPIRTLYHAIVCHGGSLRGLGIWGRSRRFASLAAAQRAGERLAITCRKVAGGSPMYYVESLPEHRVLRAAVGDHVLRRATRAECAASDASEATAGILPFLVRGTWVDAYAGGAA